MREIKFRAWDKDRKVMANVSNIDFLTGQVQMNAGGMHSERVSGDKVILLQYAGLKDATGVEIYEGDIVERTHLFNGGYGETHTGEVVYDKEYAQYVISRPQKHIEPKTEDLRNTLSDKSTYEVIGSIFENPELLEREN